MKGWIKLHRKISQWEWYDNSQMVHLFIHLILNANHEEGSWKGVEVKRGQLITGRRSLSIQTGISEKAIRTCLEKLEKGNEVAIKTTNKYSLITVINYDYYQDSENKGQQEGQQKGQQGASERATIKEVKNIQEVKEEEKIIDAEYFPFDEFWERYGRKGNKQKSKKLWEKIPREDREKIDQVVDKYVNSTPERQYRKNAETYLNLKNRCWEDEIVVNSGNRFESQVKPDNTVKHEGSLF